MFLLFDANRYIKLVKRWTWNWRSESEIIKLPYLRIHARRVETGKLPC